MARAAVAPGLVYHYFDSKQNMFDAAIEEYFRGVAPRASSRSSTTEASLDEKLDRAIEAGSDPRAFDHADFFHAEGNGALHDRLSLGRGGAAPISDGGARRWGRPPMARATGLPLMAYGSGLRGRHAGRGRRESRQALLRRPGRRVQVGEKAD